MVYLSYWDAYQVYEIICVDSFSTQVSGLDIRLLGLWSGLLSNLGPFILIAWSNSITCHPHELIYNTTFPLFDRDLLMIYMCVYMCMCVYNYNVDY